MKKSYAKPGKKLKRTSKARQNGEGLKTWNEVMISNPGFHILLLGDLDKLLNSLDLFPQL